MQQLECLHTNWVLSFVDSDACMKHSAALPMWPAAQHRKLLLELLQLLQARGRGRRHARQHVRASSTADDTKGGPSRLLSVFCPLLKVFSGSDAAAARPRWLEVLPMTCNSLLALAEKVCR